jgi:DNA-binding MarR family transcriptional regulator
MEVLMSQTDLIQIANEINVYASLLLKFYNEALEARLKKSGVTMSALQFGTLRMLFNETLTISTISQRLSLDPSTMVRSIDALERKGLAERGIDPRDRRRNPIQITKRGREFISANPVVAEDDPTLQALESQGIEQSKLLRDLLRQVISQFPEGRVITDLMTGQAGMGSEDLDE